MDTKIEIRAALEKARARTEELLAPVPDDALVAQVSPSNAPLVWELAEIAYFEDLWLVHNLDGLELVAERHEDVRRAFQTARSEPSELPALAPAATRAYMADVRVRALDALERAEIDGSALLRRGFVFGLVLQHELEQQETMLQALQLQADPYYPLANASPPDHAPDGPAEVHVPGGVFTLGAVDEPWAYDSELVPHEVELPPFWIDRTPVANGAFAEFVEANGYRSEAVWTPEGWSWVRSERAKAPRYWEQEGAGWERLRFGRHEPVPPDEPVQHVSWYEADAFARWAGKRLPAEAEWERAAGWDERDGKQRYPWGREWTGYEANLGGSRFSPTPAGSYAGGESSAGCLQMAGDVWEWTSSFFRPYPGFVAFPAPQYSEVFFGDEYRVLRGGSWATDALVARTTFRRWDYPMRRRIFAGFRCARDA